MKKIIKSSAKLTVVCSVAFLFFPTSCKVMPTFGIKDVETFKEWIAEQADSSVETAQEIKKWVFESTEVSLPELKKNVEQFIYPNAYTIPYNKDTFEGITENEYLSPSDLTANDIKRAEEMVEAEINRFNWGEPIGVADITLPGTVMRLYRLVSDNADVDFNVEKYFNLEKEISPLELTSGSLIARTFNQIKSITEKVNAENQE